MTDFEIELRDKLIEQLKLFDIEKETITRETLFFGDEGLGLDSIDALEIDFMVEKEYKIKILTSERNEATFANFGTFADFVKKNINRDIDQIKKPNQPEN
ncbi:MAG: acyl carrier protein [Spirochaetes bacterium]|nr:acyl carrier protein [Spirochaetota bacterium]